MASCIETVGGEITEQGYKTLFAGLSADALNIPIFRDCIPSAVEDRLAGATRTTICLRYGDVIEHLLFDRGLSNDEMLSLKKEVEAQPMYRRDTGRRC